MFTLWDTTQQVYIMDSNIVNLSMLSEMRMFIRAAIEKYLRPGSLFASGRRLTTEQDSDLKGLYYTGEFNTLYGYCVRENDAIPILFLPPTNGPDWSTFELYKFKHCCVLNPINIPRFRKNSGSSAGFYQYDGRDWHDADASMFQDRDEHVRTWSLAIQNAVLLLLAEYGFFTDYTPQLSWEGETKAALYLHILEPYTALCNTQPMDVVAYESMARICLNRIPRIMRADFFMLPTDSKSVMGADLLSIQAGYDLSIGWGFI